MRDVSVPDRELRVEVGAGGRGGVGDDPLALVSVSLSACPSMPMALNGRCGVSDPEWATSRDCFYGSVMCDSPLL